VPRKTARGNTPSMRSRPNINTRSTRPYCHDGNYPLIPYATVAGVRYTLASARRENRDDVLFGERRQRCHIPLFRQTHPLQTPHVIRRTTVWARADKPRKTPDYLLTCTRR